MFGNISIAIIFSLGFAGWVYAKMQKQTGGNTQTSLIVAGAAAFATFILLIILLGFIPKAD